MFFLVLYVRGAAGLNLIGMAYNMGLMRLLFKPTPFLLICSEQARFFLTKGMMVRASQVPTSKNKQTKKTLRSCASVVVFSPDFFFPKR